jgi:hypothetical protein
VPYKVGSLTRIRPIDVCGGRLILILRSYSFSQSFVGDRAEQRAPSQSRCTVIWNFGCSVPEDLLFGLAFGGECDFVLMPFCTCICIYTLLGLAPDRTFFTQVGEEMRLVWSGLAWPGLACAVVQDKQGTPTALIRGPFKRENKWRREDGSGPSTVRTAPFLDKTLT